MASKKARAKKSVSKRRASTGGKSKRPLLRTPFMADFTKAFISQGGTNLWPVANQKRADIVADFEAFVKVLLTVGYGLPAPANNGPLGDRVVQFLGAPRNWPNDPTGIPARLQGQLSTVALVDIAVILDRLLKAINAFKLVTTGKGGGPSNWPPH
jgi:hypothetical protein